MPKRDATASSLKQYTAKDKRKRTSNVTRVRFQRPTARNQQKQIVNNARIIQRLNKAVFGNRVYCDWRSQGQMFATLDAGNVTKTWFCIPLTSFPDWQAVLRQDDNVSGSSTTYVNRMQLNLRMFLQSANYAFFNVWVVTPRKDQNARDTPAAIAAGQDPLNDIDYIASPEGINLRLNSAVWKVHFAKYSTLTESTLLEFGASPPLPSGNPYSTWRKCQVNIPLKMKVRNPTSGTPWTSLRYMNLPYYHRYQLLVEVQQQAPDTAVANTGARLDWDLLATTINEA